MNGTLMEQFMDISALFHGTKIMVLKWNIPLHTMKWNKWNVPLLELKQENGCNSILPASAPMY